MTPDEGCGFTYPVGYRRFHKDQLFNFQMNRPYSLGYARLEDLTAAGQRIATFAQWKSEMLRLATEAVAEDRLMNAAFYYRAAEFYTFPEDPDKQVLYDQFSELFYRAFADHVIDRVRIPYERAFLPTITIEPQTACQGTIVLHGGYDSFIEEFYSMMRYFAAAGYRVVGFDGPGQGAARRLAGLPLDYRWEKPVGAVLDYLNLDDVTLIGLSMGGYFALRAAAFEKRVQRVIATGHAFDYSRVARRPAAAIMMFFHDHFREFTNRLSRWKMKSGGLGAWNISHLLYVLALDEPMAALEFAMALNEQNLHAGAVEQDVLIMASRDDHFIPFRLHAEQLRRLTAARSVTDRVFGKRDHAQNHCQIGNIGLALDVMKGWIDAKTFDKAS